MTTIMRLNLANAAIAASKSSMPGTFPSPITLQTIIKVIGKIIRELVGTWRKLQHSLLASQVLLGWKIQLFEINQSDCFATLFLDQKNLAAISAAHRPTGQGGRTHARGCQPSFDNLEKRKLCISRSQRLTRTAIQPKAKHLFYTCINQFVHDLVHVLLQCLLWISTYHFCSNEIPCSISSENIFVNFFKFNPLIGCFLDTRSFGLRSGASSRFRLSTPKR